MRLKTNINAITGVAANSTAIAPLARDRRYHRIIFRYSNVADGAAVTQAHMIADIPEVRVTANGKPIMRIKMAQLIELNAFYGRPYVPGKIELCFSQPNRRTPDGEELTALCAQGLNSLQVEFDIAGAAAPVALSGKAEYDFFNDRNRAFSLMEQITLNPAGAGDYDLDSLPRSGGYSKIHIFSGNVTRVRTLVDGTEIFDNTPTENADFLADYGLVPQANHFPIAFDGTNQVTDLLDMVRLVNSQPVQVQTFLNKISFSAGGSVAGVVERVVQDLRAFVA